MIGSRKHEQGVSVKSSERLKWCSKVSAAKVGVVHELFHQRRTYTSMENAVWRVSTDGL
eukprot:COSAG01_NODE_3086_length_6611_cov_12.899109_7_plen_59_part_00